MDINVNGLRIRNAAAEDAELLCRWWNDGAVMAHAGFPLGIGTTPDRIRASIALDDDTHRRCVIEWQSKPIGEMNYTTLDEGVAEIGIKLCESEYQNRGIGSEALRLFISALFDEYGFERIALDTNLNNVRAQHVYEKLGFRRLRVNRDKWRDQLGAPQSSVDYELDKADWK